MSPKTHLRNVRGNRSTYVEAPPQRRSWEGDGCLVLVSELASALTDVQAVGRIQTRKDPTQERK